MTTIGNSTTIVTLSRATPNVTINGTIDAYGSAGSYPIRSGTIITTDSIEAAIFGPATAHFTLLNIGTIISLGTQALDFGIALGAAGTLFNDSEIRGASGVAMFGTAAGAVIDNGFEIYGSVGTGLFVQGKATVQNTADIFGYETGINLAGGGLLRNNAAGFVLGGEGFALQAQAALTVQNAGFIDGYEGGISLSAGGTVSNTGHIDQFESNSAYAGIFLTDGGAVTNSSSGTINGGNGVKFQQSAGANTTAYVYNSGLINAASTIVGPAGVPNGFYEYGTAIYSNDAGRVFNTGTISGNNAAIVFAENISPTASNDIATVTNRGLIASSDGVGVVLNAGGSLNNSGTILADTQGLFFDSIANLINTGLIDAISPKFTLPGGHYTYIATGIFAFATGTLDNAAGGTVEAASGIGIELYAEYENYQQGVSEPVAGTIINAGLVTAQYAVDFYGLGGLDNTGTILGVDRGFYALNSAATGFNAGLIEVSAATFTYASATHTGTGVLMEAGGSFTNSATGTIAAAAGTGISLYKGGFVSNAGLINAYRNGIEANGGPATIVNTGTIIAAGTTFISSEGTSAISHGILLQDGGKITNSSAGTIIGETGIAVIGTATGTVINQGQVTATGHAGIYLSAGGNVINAKTGAIQSARVGIELYGRGNAYNYGAINSDKAGIYLKAGGAAYNTGSITSGAAGIYDYAGPAEIYNYKAGRIFASNGVNLKSPGYVYNAGFISASNTGIVIQAGGTVFDSGTIIGGTHGAIAFNALDSASNLLILTPGADITGTVDGGNGRLELQAAGKTVGTAAPSELLDFRSVTIESKAIWDMAGTFLTSLGLTLVNDGTIKESVADLITIAGTLEGSGLVELSKQIFTLEGGVAAGEKIQFTGTSQTLALGDVAGFDGEIEKFKIGDTIELAGLSITATHFAKGVLTLTESGGNIEHITFASPDSFGKDVFILTENAAGTAITLAKSKMAILPPAETTASATTFPELASHPKPATPPHPLTNLTMFASPGWIIEHPKPPALTPAITLHG